MPTLRNVFPTSEYTTVNQEGDTEGWGGLPCLLTFDEMGAFARDERRPFLEGILLIRAIGPLQIGCDA